MLIGGWGIVNIQVLAFQKETLFEMLPRGSDAGDETHTEETGKLQEMTVAQCLTGWTTVRVILDCSRLGQFPTGIQFWLITLLGTVSSSTSLD